MTNKPGFKVKIGGEKLIYFIIGIIIVIFIIFMPKIYKFVSDVRTGNAFKKNPIVDKKPTDNDNKKPDNDDTVKEPTGETTLLCTLTESKAEGNHVETYTFYYNSNKLESFKHEKKYDAISDDYLNFVYLEQSKFSHMNDLYKEVPGFSYTSKLENRNLMATFVYDLTKLNPESLKNSDETLTITLNAKKDQSLDEIKTIYTNLGYTCK